MNKLEKLLNNYPDEVNEVIEKLYNQKFPKKNKKTIFKFRTLGKEYTDEVFTKNYINFIKDISQIHPYEMFENTMIKTYLYKSTEGMDQMHKIKDGFYIHSYSSTKIKINHIKDICEFLGITLTQIL
jgi:hypothetical protein